MTGEIELIPGRVLGDTELVDNAKLNDLGRPVLRIKAGAVGTREMADGIITADKLSEDLTAQLGVADGSVSTAKIVDGAVTEAKLDPGVAGKLVAAGAVLQMVEQTTGYTAVNTNQYSTGSAPTSAGGNLLISKAIRPQSVSNKVRVEFQCTMTANVSEVTAIFALFCGTTLINADIFSNSSLGYCKPVCLSILDSPASVSELTYSVRFSGTGGYTVYIGGYGSAHLGGSSKATLTLTEIKG